MKPVFYQFPLPLYFKARRVKVNMSLLINTNVSMKNIVVVYAIQKSKLEKCCEREMFSEYQGRL